MRGYMKAHSLQEIVDVTLDGRGLPAEFLWRRGRHRVRRVESVTRGRIHGAKERGRPSEFNLHTERGLRCVLRQDATRGIWTLDLVLNGRD